MVTQPTAPDNPRSQPVQLDTPSLLGGVFQHRWDLVGIGGSYIDLTTRVNESDLAALGLAKGESLVVGPDRFANALSTLHGWSSSFGGSVANTLKTVAELGCTTAMITAVGTDVEGRGWLDSLQRHGVAAFARSSDRPTGRCAVLVTPDGERSMLATAPPPLSHQDLAALLPAPGRGILVDGYALASTAAEEFLGEIFAIAERSHSSVIVSLSSVQSVRSIRSALLSRLAAPLVMMVGTEAEFAALGQGSAEDGAELVAGSGVIAVLTRGDRGSSVRWGVDVANLPALKSSPALDTTGAGDAYLGGFLYGWLTGMDLKVAAGIGAEVAGQAITRRSGSGER